MSSPEELRNLITSHIAINMFPETAFEPGLIYSIDGLSSNFKVNGANVLSSHMSANGVIHVVDKVFKPSDGESYASVKRTSISTVTHRNGTTSTRTFVSTSKSSGRTHHRRVTVNEGYGKDIEEILPAFPQDRTADINFPIVRGSRVPVAYNNNSMYDKKYFSKTYENYGSKKPLENNLKIHSSNDNEYKEVVDQSDLSIPVPYSKKSVYSDYANIGKVNSQGYVRTQYDKSYYSKYNNTYYNEENSSASPLVNPILRTYNKKWDVQIPRPLNRSKTYDYERHATNITSFNHPYYHPGLASSDVNGTQASHLQHSKVYSYSYLSTLNAKPVDSTLHGSRFLTDLDSNNILSSSSSSTKDNSIRPIPPEAGKISYVGHPYGDDVVGHSSEPLPFTSAGSSYVSRNNNSVREVIRPIPQYVIDNEESKIHGVSTITHSKRVGVTRTVITHPSSSSYVAKSSRSFSFPINKKPIPSIGLDGKPRSTLLSAYAFTGEEQDFADGSEFSESRLPSEHIITVEQAKILRRQWRRKRHHQSKLKKQNKKGHKRGQKRNDKKHRKHKIEKENNENNTL
ncbi:hypothetical protein Avbf_06804 [Armadillidium vulgare]|nr:hypothetical protein Avbf_06804 [Armadillidium vulgare]